MKFRSGVLALVILSLFTACPRTESGPPQPKSQDIDPCDVVPCEVVGTVIGSTIRPAPDGAYDSVVRFTGAILQRKESELISSPVEVDFEMTGRGSPVFVSTEPIGGQKVEFAATFEDPDPRDDEAPLSGRLNVDSEDVSGFGTLSGEGELELVVSMRLG